MGIAVNARGAENCKGKGIAAPELGYPPGAELPAPAAQPPGRRQFPQQPLMLA